MPIAALAERDIRLLGPPSVITTPVALVKELVENAIDAEATSIEVAVTADTVERIEVRDNGHGIHADDYDALGRRGHTSKIRSLDELKCLGGKSLGFRGEALASANALGQVSITTRTATDPVATTLLLSGRGGGVVTRSPTSAPVGTSVAISDVFSHMPVRQKCSVKDSHKTIADVKQLLSAYALARPNLKMAFKVLNSTQPSWSYSPRKDATVREAVLQLFGVDTASQCQEENITARIPGPVSQPLVEEDNDEITEDRYLEIKAMLPRRDVATQSAKARGAFFSVDSRPVSGARGTMKKLLSIFRTHFARSATSSNRPPPRDPFIYLDIRCLWAATMRISNR